MAQLEYKSSDAIRDSDQLNRALNRNSLEFIKEVDDALVQERITLGKINLKILVFNTAMMLLLLFVVIFDYKKYQWVDKPENAEDIDQSLITLVLLLNAIVLTYSVIRIRRRINRLPNAFPNENLIAVHVLNSFIYTLL